MAGGVKTLPEMDKKLRGPQRPVVNVAWNDATEFCAKLAAVASAAQASWPMQMRLVECRGQPWRAA